METNTGFNEGEEHKHLCKSNKYSLLLEMTFF